MRFLYDILYHTCCVDITQKWHIWNLHSSFLYGHQDGKNFWVSTLSIKLESLNNYIVKIFFFFHGSRKLTFTIAIIAHLIVPAVDQLVRDVRRVQCMIVLLYNWLGTRVARKVVWVGVQKKKKYKVQNIVLLLMYILP